ncbi:hypothetical protein Tco_0128068 [Tanacetum coccineum]
MCNRKEILASPHPRKTIPLVQSCQRDPKAPALSLINQDLLYLKKGNSGPEKIVLSLHKFPAIIFNDVDIKERTSRWSHSKRLGNGVVIKEIVEDNAISSGGKDSRLLIIEWPSKQDEHVDTSNHALTSNICPVVEPTNDENVRCLYCDNEHIGDIHEKVQETLMDDDLFQQDRSDFSNKWCSSRSCVDIDEEVVEKEENIDDEEEQEEGLAEEEDENDFERDANELPH